MNLKLENFSVQIEEKEIIKPLNLELKQGINIIIGPNGTGKTTFAKALAGIIDFKGKIVPQEYIFLGFQHPPEIKGLKVKSYLSLLKKKHNSDLDVKKLVEKVGLNNNFLERNVNHNFSGGERKRFELLQMLLINPKIVVLDEVDSGVDFPTLKRLASLIKEFAKGKIVILISHSLHFIDLFEDKSIFLLKEGKLMRIDEKKVEEIEEKGF